MSDNCECACTKNLLGEIEGDEIVEVEVIGGGTLYCNAIEIRLKSGKMLVIEKELDVSKYGINPRIRYRIGGWARIVVEKDENNGQG